MVITDCLSGKYPSPSILYSSLKLIKIVSFFYRNISVGVYIIFKGIINIKIIHIEYLLGIYVDLT